MTNWFNIFGWFFSIVTATGNGFVVFLVAKNRRLHSSANWFVLSLAVADFGVGVVVFPSSYFCYNSGVSCNSRVHMAFFWFFIHSSVTNLCVLTWDRYIAIVHPFKYNTATTRRRPGMVILITWLVPFAISLTLFVGMYATESETALKVLRLTGVSAFDIISCVLLFYAVVRILVVARRHWREESAMELQVQCNHSCNEPSEPANSRRHRKHSTAPFVIALVVFFLGCYAVVNYLVLCIAFSCHKVSDNAGKVVTFLLVLNSAVNPLVYAFLKRDIKMEISRVICIYLLKNSKQNNQESYRSSSSGP
ncbi:trace amine-associated receptor 8b-like [Oculina patagonica]